MTLKDSIKQVCLDNREDPEILLIVNRKDILYYKDYILKNYNIDYCRRGENSVRIKTDDFSILIVSRLGTLARGYRADLVIQYKDLVIDEPISNCITELVEVGNKGQ